MKPVRILALTTLGVATVLALAGCPNPLPGGDTPPTPTYTPPPAWTWPYGSKSPAPQATKKVVPPGHPTVKPASFTWPTPTTTPVNRRVIEVVDQIGPAKWRVGQAAEWLDRYTASNMITVSRCSGRNWRCVYVRGGRLPGNILALTKGNTITVDTAKVDRHGWRSNLSREKILAHELGHANGIVRHTKRTVMAASMPGTRLYLNAGQRRFLATR